MKSHVETYQNTLNVVAKKTEEFISSHIMLVICLMFSFLVLWLYSSALYYSFISHHPGANDFYPRWEGTRAILSGQNPYSQAVTLKIQQFLYGHPVGPNQDQAAFAYPIFISFLIVPIASIPYLQAESLWVAFCHLGTIAAFFIILREFGFKPKPVIMALLGVAIAIEYSNLRGTLLGQPAMVTFLFYTLGWVLLRKSHDIPSGVFFALALIKPQMIVLILVPPLLWAMREKRWKVIASFITATLILVGAGCLLQPTWILDFLHAIGAYQQYTSAAYNYAPVLKLITDQAETGVSPYLYDSGVIVGIAAVLYSWWLLAARKVDSFDGVLAVTVLIQVIVVVQQGTPSQMILLFPLMFFAQKLLAAKKITYSLHFWIFTAFLFIFPWVYFFMTVQNGRELVQQTIIQPVIVTLLGVWMILVFKITSRSNQVAASTFEK